MCITGNGVDVRTIQARNFRAILCTFPTLHQVIITCFSTPRNLWPARAWGENTTQNTQFDCQILGEGIQNLLPGYGKCLKHGDYVEK
jgi:hypothetical protein